MRICYIGPLGREGTCFSRYRALCRLGYSVESIDKAECYHPFQVGRIRRSLSILLGRGLMYDRAHRQLARALGDGQFDVIWVDKSDWLQKRSVELLKARARLVVQHTTDSMWPVQAKLRLARALMRKTVGMYNVVFTTNESDIQRLRHHPGIRRTFMGYDDERFCGGAVYNPNGPIRFVGHFEPNTERYLMEAANAGIPLVINGEGWPDSKMRRIPSVSVGPALWNRDYVSALENSAIALGFLSKWNQNEITVRSFEIPASGSVLFAPRTNAHLDAFEENTEALYFEEIQEFRQKLQSYHWNREQLHQIGRAGSVRCRSSGYSWYSRMATDIATISALLRK